MFHVLKGRINHNPGTGRHCCISSGLSLPPCVSALQSMSAVTQKFWKRVTPERTIYTQGVDLMPLNEIPCSETGCILSPLRVAGLHGWLQKKSQLQGPGAAKSPALKFQVWKSGRRKGHGLEGQKGHGVACTLIRTYKKQLHKWSRLGSFRAFVKLEPTWKMLFNQK